MKRTAVMMQMRMKEERIMMPDTLASYTISVDDYVPLTTNAVPF